MLGKPILGAASYSDDWLFSVFLCIFGQFQVNFLKDSEFGARESFKSQSLFKLLYTLYIRILDLRVESSWKDRRKRIDPISFIEEQL